MTTIFSKIINGEIPSYKIFENDLVFTFLDIFPYQKGHVLIVPKIQIDYFVDVPEPYYSEVFTVAKMLAPAIEKVVSCQRVGMMVQGMDVPHFHLHLIPVFSDKPFLGKKLEFSKEEMEKIQIDIIKNL